MAKSELCLLLLAYLFAMRMEKVLFNYLSIYSRFGIPTTGISPINCLLVRIGAANRVDGSSGHT